MGTTVFLFFPETANVPVENAHTVFQDHWFWPRAYPEIKEVCTHIHSLSPHIVPGLSFPCRHTGITLCMLQPGLRPYTGTQCEGDVLQASPELSRLPEGLYAA